LFLRSTNRKKDGKDHRYFSIVENRRLASNRTVQRTVLYLGEINDQQQASWRKTLAVFDEDKQDYAKLSLFPDDRALPEDAVDSIQVRLSGLELRRARPFGNCWLASQLWEQLGLTRFWRERMPEGREAVSWEKVLRLLVVNRLLEPGSDSVCTGTGLWKARWICCWRRISPWRRRIGCTGVWIGCWSTSQTCLSG
jgi:hypothetical protein